MRCGLLGRKLAHSYSPQIHRELGDYPYLLFEKEPEEVESFLKSHEFDCLNVTIPYKKTVIPFCDELSPAAVRLGAVNTIVRKPDGTLIGHNTDFFGFTAMVKRSGLHIAGKKALVLGSGGAANTAVAVLKEFGATVITISRRGENNYSNLNLHADAALIVNATPVGMYPENGVAPLDIGLFPQLEGVLDMIYNPARTKLLMDAEEKGLVAVNGLLMLVAQAKESAEWFTGSLISDDVIPKIESQLMREMQNIILIGMPGCGKSTVGSLLSEKTGKAFVDADALIAERAGCDIPMYINTKGEAAFRALETKVLADIGKKPGLIIATGGGCVTRSENYALLHQNGKVFCLHRSLDRLPTDGRPLSQATKLEELYRIRKPLYDLFADYHIDNNGDAGAAADAIVKIWEECL
ncbi:MAG: shikimate kinase [Ruminococcaceae bacterium]|nr:shikimate kinase [Oscillospiraceae bacterium]